MASPSSFATLSLSSNSNSNLMNESENFLLQEDEAEDSFNLDQEQFTLEELDGEDSTQLLGMILPTKSSTTTAKGTPTTVSSTTTTTGEGSYSYGGSMGLVQPNSISNSIQSQSTNIPTSPTTTTSLINPNTITSTTTTDSHTFSYEPDLEINFEGWTEVQVKRYKELKEERDGLRVMNEGLETVERDLRGVEAGLERFESTIATSHALLDLYVTLSSQAEHTQQLLLDGQWEGVTKDIQILAAREAEQIRINQEVQEALEREEMERERERERKELELLKKASAPPPSTRGTTRGVRGSSVRGTTSTRGLSRPPPPSTTSSTVNTSTSSQSGIGRGGPPSTRGTVTGVRGVRGIRSRVLVRGTGVVGGRGVSKE